MASSPNNFMTPPVCRLNSSTSLGKVGSSISSTTHTVTPSQPGQPKQFEDGIVNPAGSHIHNHLPFLNSPHDLKGRPPTHPDYNKRTLRINYSQIESVQGKKLTPAQRQWWEIKQYYFDSILFFKTGKFYEIFHMDADVAVTVCNFVYMKGASAHSGFPEAGYGAITEKLLRAGYKVARVEQTETPAQLADRKKKIKGKNKPQVVSREVCSVLSIGTRTYNFLDKELFSEKQETGPLLSIQEILMRETDDGAVCQYGIVVLDVIRGSVTVGQFDDDALRSRMHTLLTTYPPSEILISSTASLDLKALLKAICPTSQIETIMKEEAYPPSTAVDPQVRAKLQRSNPVRPYDVQETVRELHRCNYFPKASRKLNNNSDDISRWPMVLQACIDGKANLALGALGASLFYLQRSLIAHEIFTMGTFKAYIPPVSASLDKVTTIPDSSQESSPSQSQDSSGEKVLSQHHEVNRAAEDGIAPSQPIPTSTVTDPSIIQSEQSITHLQLDGTTLSNLEILLNQHDSTPKGTLWQKLNHAKTPHGTRLLRAWLLRPLFQKSDIERRMDAVTELLTGDAALAIEMARPLLAKCGDLERLASRVHVMSISEEGHPQNRAILYELATYNKRKIADFSSLLKGLQNVINIQQCFEQVQCFQSGLLEKVVRSLVPDQMETELQWFLDNFDCERASKGDFEPLPGIDPEYDEASDAIVSITRELQDYQNEMCRNVLPPNARSLWKYINTKPESRDKYLIELPVNIPVPQNFYVKAKRGSGKKQVNKYRTPEVERLVQALEAAYDVQAKGKTRGMQLVFAKFDSKRPIWAAASQAIAMLDALQSLAKASGTPGFSRPTILDCDNGPPRLEVRQGRHPCVEVTHAGGEFIPNDLALGGSDDARVLLLSGPNMGGKSTLLRQTCLIAILAQIGCYVPAQSASLSPVDRIFTRCGASDRILSGQSTFFVELAEAAAALRGASRRSLVIMDELGRGTSTFDGTSIAHATVKHMIEQNESLVLFATHYHSLLEDWRSVSQVRLGHMECMVSEEDGEENITFLYTLGEGECPKSFGINVAKLAALPTEVLDEAKTQSDNFEEELRKQTEKQGQDEDDDYYMNMKKLVVEAVQNGNLEEVMKIWESQQ